MVIISPRRKRSRPLGQKQIDTVLLHDTARPERIVELRGIFQHIEERSMRFDVEDHGQYAGMKIAFDQEDLVAQSPRQASGGIQSDRGASASGFGWQEGYQVFLHAVSQLMDPAEDAGLKSVNRYRGNQEFG